MGDQNFMGGLLGGLSQTLQRQQEQNFKQALVKAQIDLIKTQAKHEEQKVKTAQTIDEFRSKYFSGGDAESQAAAGQPGQTGMGTPYVGVNDPWTKEAAATKLFLGVNLPPPNMRPTTIKLADGTQRTILNGRIISDIPGPVENEKVMGTGPGGVPTAYHLPKSFTYPGGVQGGGAAAPGGTGLGPQPPQLGGIPVGERPTEYSKVIDPTTNREILTPTYKHPLPGENVLSKPGPTETITTPSVEQKTAVTNIDTTLRTIDSLRKQAAAGGDKLFGFWPSQVHAAQQDPYSPTAALKRGLFNTVGMKPDKALITFRAGVEDFLSDFRHEKYGGALTVNEEEKFKRQASEATTLDQFNAVLDSIENKFRRKREVLGQTMTSSPQQTVQAEPSSSKNLISAYQLKQAEIMAWPDGPGKAAELKKLEAWQNKHLGK